MQKNGKQLNPVHKASEAQKKHIKSIGKGHFLRTAVLVAGAIILSHKLAGDLFAQTKDATKEQKNKSKTELALMEKKDVDKKEDESLKDRMQLKDGFLEIDGRSADIRERLAIITGGTGNLSEKDAIQKIEVVKKDIPGIYYIFNNSIARIEPRENGVSVIGGSPNDKSSFFTHKEAIFVGENGSLFAATPTTVLGITIDGDVMGFDIIVAFGEKTPKMKKPEFRIGNDPNTVEVRDETFAGLKIVIHTANKSFGVEKDDLALLGAK